MLLFPKMTFFYILYFHLLSIIFCSPLLTIFFPPSLSLSVTSLYPSLPCTSYFFASSHIPPSFLPTAHSPIYYMVPSLCNPSSNPPSISPSLSLSPSLQTFNKAARGKLSETGAFHTVALFTALRYWGGREEGRERRRMGGREREKEGGSGRGKGSKGKGKRRQAIGRE